MTGLVNALAEYLNQHGGEIRLNSKVEQIVVKDNIAKGVKLASGDILKARFGVLANCAPQVALGKLLADDILDPVMKRRIDFIPANSIGVSLYKIDIAAGKLNYNRAQAKRDKRDKIDLRKTTFMTGKLEEHILQHEACAHGEMIDFVPPLYFSILSGADSSITPENGDVLYIYVNLPLKPIGGWEASKQAYSEQIMSTAVRFIDGLDSEIGRVETCPQDFIDQFSAPNGTYFHVDLFQHVWG